MEISGKDAARLFGAVMGMDSAKVEEIISDVDDDEPKKEPLALGTRAFERKWHMANRRLGL